MDSYFISAIVAGIFLLIAASISIAIKFKIGPNPNDRRLRKATFWIVAFIAPAVFFILARYLLAPDPLDFPMEFDDHVATLPIAAGICFVIYLIAGFTLSKLFRNGKLGHWF